MGVTEGRDQRSEVSGQNVLLLRGRSLTTDIRPLTLLPAGAKRLALLREMVVVTGQHGTRVLQAVCDDPLAGTHLADGTLRISPRLCDALIEVLGHLPIDPTPTPSDRHFLEVA